MYPLTTPSEVDALREHVCFENISRNECVVTFITNKTPYQVYNTSVSSMGIFAQQCWPPSSLVDLLPSVWFWKCQLGWMCCNTGHNLNLVAPPPGRPHQITILRHQGHSRVFMIINSIVKITIISSNSSTFIIIIISKLAMMMISGGFSYGGFSYSYILRSYFGCMPWWWWWWLGWWLQQWWWRWRCRWWWWRKSVMMMVIW